MTNIVSGMTNALTTTNYANTLIQNATNAVKGTVTNIVTLMTNIVTTTNYANTLILNATNNFGKTFAVNMTNTANQFWGNGTFLKSNATVPTPVSSGGFLWVSNTTLYWVTQTKTNFVAGP